MGLVGNYRDRGRQKAFQVSARRRQCTTRIYPGVQNTAPSNQWFGLQTLAMERVAEYYYQTTGQKHPQCRGDSAKWIAGAVGGTR